jgi:hypothetical protein
MREQEERCMKPSVDHPAPLLGQKQVAITLKLFIVFYIVTDLPSGHMPTRINTTFPITSAASCGF